ncbi:hypothetical protein FDP41_007595 [Naegleria fowleri]|uniref:Uncharacterized protein n=1 Tax=Naegleria fowleri TaxID=5763 RepID=A0A6A5CDL6_NAEFO|nr:uncharacterized protein FDP41_007595 [Naegleria fowleri]KAF0983680.1 hypothetical protein FDP41_007595 [Naegleria fowleri]
MKRNNRIYLLTTLPNISIMSTNNNNCDTEILQRMNELDILYNNLLQTLQKAVQDLDLFNSTHSRVDPTWRSLGFPFHEKLRQDQLSAFQSRSITSSTTTTTTLEKRLPTFEEGQQVMKFVLNSMQIHYTGDERKHFLSSVVDATGMCGSYAMLMMHALQEEESLYSAQREESPSLASSTDFIVLEQEEETHSSIIDNLSLYKNKLNSKRSRNTVGNVLVRNQRLSEWFNNINNSCNEIHHHHQGQVNAQLVMLDASLEDPERFSLQVDQVFNPKLEHRSSLPPLKDKSTSKVCLLAKVNSDYCEKLITVANSHTGRKDTFKNVRRVYSLVMNESACKYILVFPNRREVKDYLMNNESNRGYYNNTPIFNNHRPDEKESRNNGNFNYYHDQPQNKDRLRRNSFNNTHSDDGHNYEGTSFSRKRNNKEVKQLSFPTLSVQ